MTKKDPKTTYGRSVPVAISGLATAALMAVAATSFSTAAFADDPAADQIREVLRGETVEDDGSMLGGFLDAVADRGSVIDGSILDQPKRSSTPMLADGIEEIQFLVAEQLLRSARLLRQIDPGDPVSSILVNQMRSAAIKLLSHQAHSPR